VPARATGPACGRLEPGAAAASIGMASCSWRGPLVAVALALHAVAGEDKTSHRSRLGGPPSIATLSSSRFMVQRSAPVTVAGSGFREAAPGAAQCRLKPSAYGTSHGQGGTTWSWGGTEYGSPILFSNMTVINATHATCTPPDASSPAAAVLVEGPGTLAVSMDGKNFSNEVRIDYVNLASIALGRRPYVAETAGHIVFRSDVSLTGSQLRVHASLPSVPGKAWDWSPVAGGTDLMLPLSFDGLPERVHNDMNITCTLPDGSSFSVWRRFMKVPAPPPGSSIEPVQLDATRSGILIGGKPFIGRGYYISGLKNNESIPERQRYSVPRGIAAEIARLTEVVKPGDPPVINMGEIYGLGGFSPADQLAVLDAAAAVGFKVQYDLQTPGIQIDKGGPFDNETSIQAMTENVRLVRNHSALLGCGFSTRYLQQRNECFH
jgi:hypothetical protein